MKKAKITTGISLPNNLHAVFDRDGNFSRLLKVNSKVNFLEYIARLNEIYEKQGEEEDYKQRIIDLNSQKEENKSIKQKVFFILLIGIIILIICMNITSNIFTIPNLLKFLGLVLGDFIITNVSVNALFGSNKTLDKHVKYFENLLRETRKEKQKLLSLCKEKEQEFEISEIPLVSSEKIDNNSVNRNELHKEKWYLDNYK